LLDNWRSLEALLNQEPVEAVLTDLHMPGADGFEVVQAVRRSHPGVPVIIMTGMGSTDAAIEAMKAGAFEYITKPASKQTLVETLQRAVASHRLMRGSAIGAPKRAGARGAIVGDSPAMLAAYKEVGRVAGQPVTVLIRGETGTGKELFARAIYQHSNRADKPFLAVNCAAIPETLLESELFGHEKGAFTGAVQRRLGRFEQCDGGTLFLDEIGELSAGTQAKLLRVLQEQTIQRLGSTETVKVDVRIIAATNRDLETMVREKKFREDLFYRLDVVTIHLPPLRERREDIPELVHALLHSCGEELKVEKPKIEPAALKLLQEYDWPGNVRELENTLRRALLLAQGYVISPEHVRKALSPERANQRGKTANTADLGDYIRDLLAQARSGAIDSVWPTLVASAEAELYKQAIEAARGNQAKAAKWIGVSRVTIHQKLLQLGLLNKDGADR
jgi:DNA-binding NtrC family response regulator